MQESGDVYLPHGQTLIFVNWLKKTHRSVMQGVSIKPRQNHVAIQNDSTSLIMRNLSFTPCPRSPSDRHRETALSVIVDSFQQIYRLRIKNWHSLSMDLADFSSFFIHHVSQMAARGSLLDIQGEGNYERH
ncbi:MULTISPECIES: hypothetical protein [unclassified Serratia (in: enterobacteria)]|uniref:hypothetical protein n=1 Tax=unclassified Serratia (in: enterobacteria) TaxID=2647522 RepID=UPI0012697D23|nr:MULTISPECIES: hypothetical protein [unclassified Serratia (in: enterobacteria)]